jgi:hypothetical protein
MWEDGLKDLDEMGPVGLEKVFDVGGVVALILETGEELFGGEVGLHVGVVIWRY